MCSEAVGVNVFVEWGGGVHVFPGVCVCVWGGGDVQMNF